MRDVTLGPAERRGPRAASSTTGSPLPDATLRTISLMGVWLARPVERQKTSGEDLVMIDRNKLASMKRSLLAATVMFGASSAGAQPAAGEYVFGFVTETTGPLAAASVSYHRGARSRSGDQRLRSGSAPASR